MSEMPQSGPLRTNIDNNDVKTCPSCKRKLLTQTSALCNWCGKVIDDPEYQQKAAQTRHQHDEQERALVDAAVHVVPPRGVLSRLLGRNKSNAASKTRNDLAP